MFEDNDDAPVTLTINKAYANKYQTWREKEEKQKLIARYGSDVEDDSDEESEDDNAEEWTDEVEKEFLRCYSILKKGDPRIYDSNTKFFSQASTSEEDDETNKKKKEQKKMTLKDAEIQYAFAEAIHKDDDHDDTHIQTNGKRSIIEEQEEIKKSIKKVLATTDDDVLLTKKLKTEEEKAKEEQDYIEWLKGQKAEINDSTIKSDLKYLHDYWNDPSLSERDRFLRDFILNKMHLQNGDDDDDDETRIPSYDEIVNQNEDEDEDEEELEKAEEFERKYNFRFQEPDAEFLKRYPRTIDDTVRRKDDRRKLKRLERKERKELERKQKLEEIKRLKNLKKKEILDKMKRLKTVAGDEDLPVNIDDLDADFDPKEYDRQMQQIFNDEYYEKGADEEEKPEISDEELQVENWDQNEEKEEVVTKPVQSNNQEDPQTKKSKKKSKLCQAISQPKPKFNPKEKSFEQYFDEYYKLDCEDFIGNMPVRFQYRQVEPNDFGLTVEEILAAEDRELNAWCSLKKTSQYRSKDEELRDYHVYRNKAKDFEKKQKILTSVYEEKNDKDANESLNEERPKSEAIIANSDQSSTSSGLTATQKNKKRKKKHLSDEQRILTDMSDERLQVYGLNPKRFRNFVRFNKDKKN